MIINYTRRNVNIIIILISIIVFILVKFGIKQLEKLPMKENESPELALNLIELKVNELNKNVQENRKKVINYLEEQKKIEEQKRIEEQRKLEEKRIQEEQKRLEEERQNLLDMQGV